MEEEHNAWRSVVLVAEDMVHLVLYLCSCKWFVRLSGHLYVTSLSLSPFFSRVVTFLQHGGSLL
jgi:hypothetical protein